MKSQGKSFVRSGGLRKAAALAVGLPLLLSSVALPAQAAPSPEKVSGNQAGVVKKNLDPSAYKDGRYMVVLAEKPAATYDGGTPGLAPTKPEEGKKLDSGSVEVKDYQKHLQQAQQEVAQQENITIERDFTTAVNGFSANLTADQAISLAKDPKVLMVAPDTQYAPDYSTTDFLKLSGPNGTWATQYGGQENAGKGTVVGVIVTGYTPTHTFFAGDPVGPLFGDPQVGVP